MTNETIESHEDWQNSLVKEFSRQIVQSVDEIDAEMRDVLSRSMQFEGDMVTDSSENNLTIRGLDRLFREATKLSGYDAAVGSFVGHFSDEVHNFFSMYQEMQSALPALPDISISESDADDLGNRASAAVAALDSIATDVCSSLRKSSALLVGNVQKTSFLNHVSNIVQRAKSVDLVGKNLLTSFFRRAANLGYRSVEPNVKLSYAYAGTPKITSREFCRRLMDRTDPITRLEIAELDNGQIPGVMENAGGANCSHFWWVVGAEAA